MTDAFFLLSVATCDIGCINVSAEFLSCSLDPDGDKNYSALSYLLPFPPRPFLSHKGKRGGGLLLDQRHFY